MKKLVVILFAVAPALGFSQIKPSIPKAETALRAGKLDEAKSIIDATTGNQEFMVDKKGQPTKNAVKAWYLRGIIYASIDTSRNEKYKNLDPNPFAQAKEGFDKAMELDGGKSQFLFTDKNGFPMLYNNVNTGFAQAIFNKAIAEYSEKKNYKKAFEHCEQTLYFIPQDTAVIMNAGVFFGPSADETEKSIQYLNKYISMGGTSSDAYVMLFSLTRDKLKDNEKALLIIQDAIKKYPKNADFPKYELDLFVKMNRLPDAKISMEKQVAEHPDDKESRYFLAVINSELGNPEEAKKWYQEAIKLDPKYYEPHLGLAEIVYLDAKSIKVQMNQLGISKEDTKKKIELDKIYVEKLKVSLPYWQQCEKMSPDDAKVLDTLLGIYTDLDMQPELTKLAKHMKALGLLD
ncbi:MAG TPA: tetratricopeptide repeat protein [Cyclobacteriaceae bacterium]|nr:tetratricopeptide repeat protein [Cyclobacteriaceae bacterium]